MKVLVADDDHTTCRILEGLLSGWGYQVTAVHDGGKALEMLQSPDSPPLAIIDWVMPESEIDGLEVCERLRMQGPPNPLYLILLTVKGRKEDIVRGLEAGADDYIPKPFDHEELRARVYVGRRIVELQNALAARIVELQDAAAHIRTLQGILPICSYCNCIRDDKDYWHRLESYFSSHLDLLFSHTYCPTCYEKHVKPHLEKLKREPPPED